MSIDSLPFQLRSSVPDAPEPVLTQVDARGRLDGLLFELTLRQTYRNTSRELLEVVYTFPLPAQAVLLGFASELNGVRQAGRVVEAEQAERGYEAALAAGDAPVMLEALGPLHSASIGNLQPGETIVLECRFAQWLSFDQGRLRVCLPTTIAPRYGSPQAAGLQPQQVPSVSLEVDYPFHCELTIGPSLARAEFECPTHTVRTEPQPDGSTRVRIADGARLDRDLVLLLTPREARPSLLCTAADPLDPLAPVVAVAVLQVPDGPPRERLAVKLLVDASGSMAGDSMASAQAALRELVQGLGERDLVSFSAFGSAVEHRLPPVAARPVARRRLARLIHTLQADLGGTEMEMALESVLALPLPQAADRPDALPDALADVLLITDGEVWKVDEVVRAARASGQRIFAIGVGSSPAESVLRDLAEATGGACEFATPGESLEAAARRMLRRMRQPRIAGARVDWGQTPVWTTRLPSLFPGDTAIVCAGLPASTGRPVRLMAAGPTGMPLEWVRTEAGAPSPGDLLPRMAAAARLPELPPAEACALALRHQLMTDQTRCLIVHERSEAERPTAEAIQVVLPSMLAAGWGGTGTIRKLAHSAASASEVWSCGPLEGLAPVFEGLSVQEQHQSMPRLLSEAQRPVPSATTVWAQAVAAAFARGPGGLDGLADRCEAACPMALLPGPMAQALAGLQQQPEPLSRDEAWALLAAWLLERGAAEAEDAGDAGDAGAPSLTDALNLGASTRLQAAWNWLDGALEAEGIASGGRSSLRLTP